MKISVLVISALAAVASAQNPASTIMTFREEPRHLRAQALDPYTASSVTSSALTITQSVIPLLMGNSKSCHQVACWIATSTEACALAGANQAQSELMKSRNSFAVESQGQDGMWVRYWRTQFSPPDRGDIAKGDCSDGNSFVVNNCQQTGKVYC